MSVVSVIGKQDVEPISLNDLIQFKNDISQLDKTEQLEILKIIKKYKVKLTENNNGVFINLNNVHLDCYKELTNFVKYSLGNHKRLANLEKLSENIFKKSMLKQAYDNYSIHSELSKTPKSTSSVNPYKIPKKPINLSKSVLEIEDLENSDEKNEIGNNLNTTIDDDLEDNLPNDNVVDISNEEQNEISDELFKESKKKLTGSSAKILKKCKEINKYSQSSLEISNFKSFIQKQKEIIEVDTLSELNDESIDNITIESNEIGEFNDELTEEFI